MAEIRVYRKEARRCVAMPLGGLGCGSMALCGDGSLRQWQVVNQVNHIGYVPHSFFALRYQARGGLSHAYLLQSKPPEGQAAPLITDHYVPDDLRELTRHLPTVPETEFTGLYPMAQITYHLPHDIPLVVSLQAFSPFAPLDPEVSGLPAILFLFDLVNRGETAADVALCASLQNFTGWDNVTPIRGRHCALFGGNHNVPLRLTGSQGVWMLNERLPKDHPAYGELVLAMLGADATLRLTWTDLEEFWADFVWDGRLEPGRETLPTASGETVNAGVATRFLLEPNERRQVRIGYAWYFPNRYVNWSLGSVVHHDTKSRFWLGNAYNNRFKSAIGVWEYLQNHQEELIERTRRFVQAFEESTLPGDLTERVTSQISTLRTPVCLWIEDGTFHGFEGGCGGSAGGPTAVGGCCPMDCTHVWNYERTLSALFPSLTRTMRDVNLKYQLNPRGYLPHRLVLPIYLPRLWDRPIGGPHNPAVDGLFGEVLKTYREVRHGASLDWLKEHWSRLKQIAEYVLTGLDPDGDGVIVDEQPNTYDISIYGANTFIGTLFLAALRALEEMAHLLEEPGFAAHLRERFEKGYENYDRICWREDFGYFVQVYDKNLYKEHQWGIGCHSDQLLGQWWAHVLELGYVLPPEHVRRALQSIVQHNFRQHFRGFKQEPRVFASEDDPGLLNCTWHHGGRPEVVILYADEVWTGIEYQVAALCLWEGMTEEANQIISAICHRYDGVQRNPWNEIECGDHYVRAMSSWSVLEAALGYGYDAPQARLTLAPRLPLKPLTAPFFAHAGWGTVHWDEQEVRLQTLEGSLNLKQLRLGFPAQPGRVEIYHEATSLQARSNWLNRAPLPDVLEITFDEPINLQPGEVLRVRV